MHLARREDGWCCTLFVAHRNCICIPLVTDLFACVAGDSCVWREEQMDGAVHSLLHILIALHIIQTRFVCMRLGQIGSNPSQVERNDHKKSIPFIRDCLHAVESTDAFGEKTDGWCRSVEPASGHAIFHKGASERSDRDEPGAAHSLSHIVIGFASAYHS